MQPKHIQTDHVTALCDRLQAETHSTLHKITARKAVDTAHTRTARIVTTCMSMICLVESCADGEDIAGEAEEQCKGSYSLGSTHGRRNWGASMHTCADTPS